jgi:two-component system cell cycle sensor histidine kinase/response regulator CckA
MNFRNAVHPSTGFLQRALATAWEASTEAMVMTDEHGIVQFCNRAIEEITGYSRLEMIGKRLNIWGPDPHMPSAASHARGLDAGEDSETILCTSFPLERNSQGNPEWRSRSWEATGRMAAGIAHDFCNVVSVVNGCSEWLLSRIGPDQHHSFRDRVCQIRQAGQRGAELIHQLLTLSKAKTGAARVIGVNEQIRRASSTLQHLAGMDVKFNLELDPQAGMIGGDSTQFLQVLFNLTANARDAMPNGGTLTIATGHRDLQRALKDVQPCQGQPKPGGYVTVTVTDSGTGMGELTRSRTFDPFFTTKDFGKGTGLGLSFVADVVRRCGGHVEVETEVGGGSTFRLYFPELAAEHVATNGTGLAAALR